MSGVPIRSAARSTARRQAFTLEKISACFIPAARAAKVITRGATGTSRSVGGASRTARSMRS